MSDSKEKVPSNAETEGQGKEEDTSPIPSDSAPKEGKPFSTNGTELLKPAAAQPNSNSSQKANGRRRRNRNRQDQQDPAVSKAQQFNIAANVRSTPTPLSLAPPVNEEGDALASNGTVISSSACPRSKGGDLVSGAASIPMESSVGAYQSHARPLGDLPTWGHNKGQEQQQQEVTVEAHLVEEQRITPLEIESSVLAEAEAIDTSKRYYYAAGFTTLLVAFAVLLAVLLSSNEDGNAGVPTERDTVLATVPHTICFDRMPGEGHSKYCSQDDTFPNGGGVGNLVAQAHLSMIPHADMVIHNAGTFRSDIVGGNFTGGDCEDVIPFNNQLMIVDLRGIEVQLVLEQGLENIYADPNHLKSGSYPYAAGLKFAVDFSGDFGKRVSYLQVQDRVTGVWGPLEEYGMYTVVTSSFLADGGDNYVLFSKIPTMTATNLFTQDSLREFAWNQKVLEDPPPDKYSTISFIPRPNYVPDDPDAIIASAPETICFDRMPGEGRSKVCGKNATKEQGSGVQNLVSQAMLYFFSDTADLVVMNAGSVMADIKKGNVTVADAEKVVPFNNELLLLNMTGSEIKLALEQALEYIFSDPTNSHTGAYPYAAGMKYSVNMSATFQNRLSDVQVQSRGEGNWNALDLGFVYRVLANEYIAGGGNNYLAFTAVSNVTATGLRADDAFLQYAWEQKVLRAPSLDDFSTISFIPR